MKVQLGSSTNYNVIFSIPVMNISFVVTEFDVMEGEGVVTLVLEKTDGAVGPVVVKIFTVEGTAFGMLI